MRGTLSIVLAMLALAGMLSASPDSTRIRLPEGAIKVNAEPAELVVNSRKLIKLRATILGNSPEQRVAGITERIRQLLSHDPAGVVSHESVDGGMLVKIDGHLAFAIAEADLDPTLGETMTDALRKAEQQLRLVIAENHEMMSASDLLVSIGVIAGVTLLLLILLRFLGKGRRWVSDKILQGIQKTAAKGQTISDILSEAAIVQVILYRLVMLIAWLVGFALVFSWLSFSLQRLPYTRPIGEQLVSMLVNILMWAFEGIRSSIPDLLVITVICFLTVWVNRFIGGLLKRVEHGTLHFEFLERETAKPTRRILSIVLWLFALTLAYPYIPGSDSEAFKGVGVLAGLMLSLGASSSVGQALSGLVLMYSRSVRLGEFVTIGEKSGTVTRIGFFSTRLRTAFNEEVILPNSTVSSSVVVNHTRLMSGQQAYSTTVTIGYDAPWRLVQSMLLEGASRVSGISDSPAPFVNQTELQDHYVVYRLTVAIKDSAPRAATISALHGAIQDVFNENGIQIMSPHYVADADPPKIIAPEDKDPSIKRGM